MNVEKRYRIEPNHRGPESFWVMPDPKKDYVIGADAAEGLRDGDPSAACVIDLDTAEQVAELHGAIDPYTFADMLCDLGEFYNNALIVPEINNHGIAVLQRLKDNGYWNLYSRRSFDSATYTLQNRLGWQTTVKSRDNLVGLARGLFNTHGALVRSKKLLSEMLSFVFEEKTGKEEAQQGCHDDLVFAWMLALEGRKVAFYQRPTRPEARYTGADKWIWERFDRMAEQKERDFKAGIP